MLHVLDVDGVVVDVGVGEVGAGEEDCVVGMTTTALDEAALDADVDVEGWTYVTDVSTATPAEELVPSTT